MPILTHRPLTELEATALHTELKTTPNILDYTVRELLRFEDVWVADVNGEFAGACISKDLRWRWTDIAVLYVLPDFRGRGLARELYTAAWERATSRKRHIYTLSCSPEVIHLMTQFGMETHREIWKAPLAVHLHMNRHLMSRYRWAESLRKQREMKRVTGLIGGTRRFQNPAP